RRKTFITGTAQGELNPPTHRRPRRRPPPSSRRRARIQLGLLGPVGSGYESGAAMTATTASARGEMSVPLTYGFGGLPSPVSGRARLRIRANGSRPERGEQCP